MGRKTWWQKLRTELAIVVWTILYFLVMPIVLVLLTPVYMFRFIASQCRKVLRPDLDKMVTTRSAVLARDDWSTKPHWNLVVWLTQEGILDLDRFRKDFYSDFVNKRESSTGKFVYPEYQQHYVTWWGFLFWRWDPDFDIKNHIRLYDGVYQDEEIDEDKLLFVVKELTWKAWHPTRSPWEFLQIQNYVEKKKNDGVKKSLLIFRIHHGLGDGYYILKLLMQDICGISLERALGKPQYVQRNLFQKFLLGFLFWIRAPYQFVEMLVRADDINKWHLPMKKLTKPMNVALADCIPLDYVKSIKNMHNVTFTAVMTAAITGGIRNLMIEKGIPVPNEMHTGVAVPMPGHPHKLRNHFIFSFIALPISLEDPIKRLKKMNKNYMQLKRSTAPLVNFFKVPLAGGLPSSLMVPFVTNRLSTCLISNFPGTPDVPIFKGVKVLDMMFNAGLGEGSTGLGFCLISYVNHIRFIAEADPGILESDAEVGELVKKIVEELDVFHALGVR